MKLSRPALFHRSPNCFAALCSLCVLLCFAGVSGAQAQKIGVVDVNKVFKNYYKTKDIEKTIFESRAAAKKEIDDRMEHHHQLLEEIARLDQNISNPALSEQSKADLQQKRTGEVRDTHLIEQDIQELKTTRENQLQEQIVRLRTQIVEDIMVIVNARFESGHYDLILNKSGRGLGEKILLLYANDKLEISDDVIAALNKNSPPGAAATK